MWGVGYWRGFALAREAALAEPQNLTPDAAPQFTSACPSGQCLGLLTVQAKQRCWDVGGGRDSRAAHTVLTC